MLVSISAVTVVQVGPCPSSACPGRSSKQRAVESLFPFPLSFRCLVEIFQPVSRRNCELRSLTRRNDSDGFSCGLPLNLIARFDVKAVGDGFGESYLQLACHLAHVLTLARIISLSTDRHTPRQQRFWRLMGRGHAQVPLYKTTISVARWLLLIDFLVEARASGLGMRQPATSPTPAGCSDRSFANFPL